MPSQEIGLGVDVSNVVLQDGDKTDYSIPDAALVTKAGEDGDVKVLQLYTGNKFVGESLGSEFRRAWDANIDTFTAILDSANEHVELSGVAAIAGTAGNGWVNGQVPVLVCKNLTATVKMQVPVDDTGAVANRDIRQSFFIKQDKDELQPDDDDNFIEIRIDVDESGLILEIYKEVNGSNTLLDSGFDFTMDASRDTGDLEATIWRLVPNGKPGTSGATLSIFLRQSDTLANAALADENELDGSPYDISDLAFFLGYASLRIYSQNTTYFGAFGGGNEGIVGEIDFSYPNLRVDSFTQAEADIELGGVQLWDGDPDSGGVRVWDTDHVFSDDLWIKNSLIQMQIDEAVSHGLKLGIYNGASYVIPYDEIETWLGTDATNLQYPHLRKIVSWSPEEAVIQVRLTDSATDDNDFYTDINLTFLRGSYYVKFEYVEVFPVQEIEVRFDTTSGRFAYVGNNVFGDTDLSLSGSNSTLDDNFLIGFDDAGEITIAGMFFNLKPDGTEEIFRAFTDELIVRDFTSAQQRTLEASYYLTPFADIANLFIEAEDATTTGGTVEADGAASGGQVVRIDTAGENVRYEPDAGTDLPAGNYLAVFRMKDSNQVAGDCGIRVWNDDDNEYMNEEGTRDVLTLTGTFAFYSIFFQITDTDVTGTVEVEVRAEKIEADANDIDVDYFLLIYLGNGETGPQVDAHNALRSVTKNVKHGRR